MSIPFSPYQAKNLTLFDIWLTKLCAHRSFKKNEAMSVHHGVLHALSAGNGSLPAMASLAQRTRAVPSMVSGYQSRG